MPLCLFREGCLVSHVRFLLLRGGVFVSCVRLVISVVDDSVSDGFIGFSRRVSIPWFSGTVQIPSMSVIIPWFSIPDPPVSPTSFAT